MSRGPDLLELYRLFRSDAAPPAHAVIGGDEMPEPYRSLLVHSHHMTVTVESFYNGPVAVRVLDRRSDGDAYSRKILLEHVDTGQVVQFGIIRVHLNYCSAPVRAAILAEATPLGRILIEHGVLRRVEPTAYFRVETGPALAGWFGLSVPATTYGRLGIIHCDEQPAIDLLEVLAPLPPLP